MPKTDTKQRIIDTATSLFSSHGFCATSIDDILKGVGITKGAFYHYFKGKDHLCEAVLECAIGEYHQLADTLDFEKANDDPLYQWYRVLIEKQTSGQWLYCRLLGRLSIESAELNAVMQNKLRVFWFWYQSFYETLIKRVCVSKSVSFPAEPAEMARLYMAAHFGAACLDRFAPAPQDLTNVCETLLKLSIR